MVYDAFRVEAATGNTPPRLSSAGLTCLVTAGRVGVVAAAGVAGVSEDLAGRFCGKFARVGGKTPARRMVLQIPPHVGRFHRSRQVLGAKKRISLDHFE